MINIVIIEDESRCCDYLRNLLGELDTELRIVECCSSVAEGLRFLSLGSQVDLIFSDVRLGDGLSFSIFESLKTQVPVVFVTAYDEFMLEAFETNGIDYLLKPVCKEGLQKAVGKFRAFQRHFAPLWERDPLHQFLQGFQKKGRTRILVRRGVETLSKPLAEIVLFFSENKVAYAVDRAGKKLMVDKSLSDLEKELDRRMFFRANRQYLLNIDYIKSFKTYERVKLWVELTIPDLPYVVTVSQETAPLFRKWLLEA